MNDTADAFRNRIASVALRKEFLEKQKMKNYSSEYDRLRAHLETNSTMPYQTRSGLKNRVDHLKALGARAVESIV